MAIELHHLQPSHDDELSRLKARIADLEDTIFPDMQLTQETIQIEGGK